MSVVLARLSRKVGLISPCLRSNFFEVPFSHFKANIIKRYTIKIALAQVPLLEIAYVLIVEIVPQSRVKVER